MPYIKNIFAREVIDAFGNPAIDVEVYTQCGAYGSAVVSSGVSEGIYEAVEIRDMQEKRYMGRGVLRASEHINTVLLKRLLGMCVFDQQGIDHVMIEADGTDNKGNIGANAILAVSIACAKAAAACLSQPLYRYLGGCFAHVLPVPMLTIINGEESSGKKLCFKEFMIMPVSAPNYREAIRMGCEIYYHVEKILMIDGYFTAAGKEGGFIPGISSNEKILAYIIKGICEAGYQPGKDVTLGVDVSAGHLWVNGKYHLVDKEDMEMDTDEFIEYYEYLCSKFPLRFIEDGLDPDDWDGWTKITQRLGPKVTLAGDDFFSTDPSRICMGAGKQAANGAVINMNQVGTVTETFYAVNSAKQCGYDIIISRQGNDSEDTFLADFCVAVNAGKFKAGSVCRAEGTAKYNRLLKIYDELSNVAGYGHLQ